MDPVVQGGGENSAASLGAPKPDARFFIFLRGVSTARERARARPAARTATASTITATSRAKSEAATPRTAGTTMALLDRVAADLHMADPVRNALRRPGYELTRHDHQAGGARTRVAERVLRRKPRLVFYSSLDECAIFNTTWIDRPVDTRGLHSLLPRRP